MLFFNCSGLLVDTIFAPAIFCSYDNLQYARQNVNKDTCLSKAVAIKKFPGTFSAFIFDQVSSIFTGSVKCLNAHRVTPMCMGHISIIVLDLSIKHAGCVLRTLFEY